MTKPKNGKARVLKIGRQAVFEFVYENMIDKLKEYFDINRSKEACLHYGMNYDTGDFVMIATYENDFDAGLDIDTDKLVDKLDTTADSMFSPGKKYIEMSLDDLLALQNK